MIKVVFLDIDGTIYVPGEPGIRSSVLREIRRAQQKGVKVFIASGRPSSAIPAFLNEVHADGFILSNGAQLRIGSMNLNRFLPEEAIRKAAEMLDAEKIPYSIQTETVTYNVRDMLDYYALYGIHTEEFDGDPEKYGRTLKIEFKLRPEEVNRIAGYPKALGLEYHPDGTSMEFNDPGCSKGKALARAAELLGIRIEETAAFGDAVNDIEMIRAAGTGVAMANAKEDVRAAANLIAPDVRADGVAVMLRRLMEEKE